VLHSDSTSDGKHQGCRKETGLTTSTNFAFNVGPHYIDMQRQFDVGDVLERRVVIFLSGKC
jgi:hypothetical protein